MSTDTLTKYILSLAALSLTKNPLKGKGGFVSREDSAASGGGRDGIQLPAFLPAR